MTSQSVVDILHIDWGCFNKFVVDLIIKYKFSLI